jgi:hypothetical protein
MTASWHPYRWQNQMLSVNHPYTLPSQHHKNHEEQLRALEQNEDQDQEFL